MKCPALLSSVKNSLPLIGIPVTTNSQLRARILGTTTVTLVALSAIGQACVYAASRNLPTHTLYSPFTGLVNVASVFVLGGVSTIAGMVTGLAEIRRVNKQKCLKEFRNALFPALDYTELARDKNLIKFLIEQKVDLTKKNQEGNTLLNAIVTGSTDPKKLDPETFALVYQNANWSIEQKCDAIKVMARPAVPLLKKAVEQGIIKGSDFPSEQQVRLLSSLHSASVVRYLKQAGFDLNAKDTNGYTPLLRIAERTYSRFSAGLAEELISQGADLTATVMVKGIQKNVFKLALERGRDPELIAVLEKHILALETPPKSTMPVGA